MAILKAGANGPFSGKVGSIVGYELYGQGIIRSLPRKSNRPPTKLQIINRARIKVCSAFLSEMKKVIAFGYQYAVPEGSRFGTFQQAQSYILKNSLDYDEDGMPYVNPEKVLFFRGDLPVPSRLEFEVHEKGLLFRWAHDAALYDSDQLVAMFYNPEQNQGDILMNGAIYKKGEYLWEMDIERLITEGSCHVYAGFHSPLHKQMSNSVYCGSF
ncbi:DUF6266 family protein [Sphingobacterium sp. UT-1RO-CII-1]|uniref:DUF6266 family protein n=1 Tax=Sphingobacterium sp. UT-1RO-CII-1 TaxID=2995225 RepID=UPI00227B5217|nr:DUF6266 family protein [Sphingobacterium sp. UT-1RO-CII-1]MCY4778430.1 DUF6266 family protein [Sphingobacterium sp. UT-1RO-CII-1]